MKQDNIDIINKLVWWIPFKKLRNRLRDILLYNYNSQQNIINKLDYISGELYNISEALNLNNNKRKDRFNDIFNNNFWKNKESLSGPGSTLKATEHIRNKIPYIIKKYNIKTILDAPCGDMNWMKELINNFEYYIGVDIVENIISNHKNNFANHNNIEFKCLDIINDKLPNVDLIFSRDCIQHLSNQEVIKFINNIKVSNSKYLFIGTTLNIKNNDRIPSNLHNWQYLNLEESPFYFPKALEYIEDYGSDDDFRKDTFMALYEINKL